MEQASSCSAVALVSSSLKTNNFVVGEMYLNLPDSSVRAHSSDWSAVRKVAEIHIDDRLRKKGTLIALDETSCLPLVQERHQGLRSCVKGNGCTNRVTVRPPAMDTLASR
jgi:hypothetical protein